MMLPPDAGLEAPEDLRRSMGVDKPLIVQYGKFISDYARGSFGESLRSKTPVSDLIKDRLPNSVKLIGAAFVIVILISLPLGVLSAVYKGTWIDTASTGITVLGQAIPVFWLGILMIQLFTVQLGWLPSSGMDGIKQYIMPAFSLGFFTVTAITNHVSASFAKRDADPHSSAHAPSGMSHHRRGLAKLLGPWHPAHHSGLGFHAGRRERVRVHRLVGHHRAGCCNHAGGLGVQPLRRLAAGEAGPEATQHLTVKTTSASP